ncbi:GAP family protein [Rhodococcus sp. IEGM 1381]|uniref:GAP family protein n=1 Tax=Rhodococcus sp. IEGM 1381 TaxID=3047085 RepID=UPI0024B6893F|nr:GAP family protein [Rhodococcus sp. IEGM 1381]MDI9894353.1 GAP family protein [Rhodococcus sp. IEGM 1381]
MLTAGLLATIAGLAAVDSLNPATIAGVTLILLAPIRRPGVTAGASVAGAYAVVLAVGAGLYVGSDAIGGVVESGAAWVRRIALLLAAVILLISAVKRLRPRIRAAVRLPPWFGPWTAAPLGVVATGADLPNAFPYLIAIERLNAEEVPVGTGIAVLAVYALVYCIPCLTLLGAGLVWRDRITARLQRVYDRLGGERPQPRSVPVAAALALLACAVGTVAFVI